MPDLLWYSVGICGIGNPVVAGNSDIRKPIGERASSKLQVADCPALYAATKPKARSPMGFLLSGRDTPQGGLADGPEWAAPRKHRRRDTPRALRPDLMQVLVNTPGNSGGTRPGG